MSNINKKHWYAVLQCIEKVQFNAGLFRVYGKIKEEKVWGEYKCSKTKTLQKCSGNALNEQKRGLYACKTIDGLYSYENGHPGVVTAVLCKSGVPSRRWTMQKIHINMAYR